jgi:hypothetical protein
MACADGELISVRDRLPFEVKWNRLFDSILAEFSELAGRMEAFGPDLFLLSWQLAVTRHNAAIRFFPPEEKLYTAISADQPAGIE